MLSGRIRARIIQLCSIGCSEQDCKDLLGKTGIIIDTDDTFAEGQSLLRLDDNNKEIWFFNAELIIL